MTALCIVAEFSGPNLKAEMACWINKQFAVSAQQYAMTTELWFGERWNWQSILVQQTFYITWCVLAVW